ncbi:MAG: magnesium chelatase domain-containing protein [Actinomycetota bacterium]|nr:magnesium chelatase domain-containing protein [Actinomycetota bacterium]
MINCVSYVVLVGVKAGSVGAEMFVGGGSPCFHLAGLRDAAVRGVKRRVWAAFERSELTFPCRRVVVNCDGLSPISHHHVAEAVAHRGRP